MAIARRHGIQAAAVGAGLLPLAGLALAAARGGLGANPIETITHTTGEWALRWLLVSLAVTPARRWLGWSWAAPLRRSFGLLAFGYATLHLATWAVLDLWLDPAAMAEDLLERRYIAAGFTAFACLLPLALTSTRAAMRRLGRRWVTLHRLAYLAGVAAVVHFAWLAKGERLEPFVYAGLLGLLLALRIRPMRPAPGRVATKA